MKLRITSYNVCYTKLLRKNATENAIISVALDNYDEMYSSEREGYTGAYKKESGSWKVNISNGDVYSKLKSGLNLKKDGVITSYSIHYTKLYEILASQNCHKVSSLSERNGHKYRITSYNVCYTKLLRF